MQKISFCDALATLGWSKRYQLASLANVELADLNGLFYGHPVSPQKAQSILVGLSQLAQKTYTLENVDIPVLEGQVQS